MFGDLLVIMTSLFLLSISELSLPVLEIDIDSLLDGSKGVLPVCSALDVDLNDAASLPLRIEFMILDVVGADRSDEDVDLPIVGDDSKDGDALNEGDEDAR